MKKILYAFAFAIMGVTAVAQTPTFDLSVQSGCPPLMVKATNTSTLKPGIHYRWYFGEGSYIWSYDTSAVQHPTHIYNTVGSYTVYLEQFDGSFNYLGGTNKVVTVQGSTGQFFINPSDSACPGTSVQFYTYMTNSSHSWDFGDGNTGSGSSAFHTFTTPGVYPVTLYLTTPCGPDTIVKMFKVSTKVQAQGGFTLSSRDVCLGEPVSYSSYYTNQATHFDFGDGATSSQTFGKHVYAAPGQYYIKQDVTNACGNSTQVVDSVTVHSNLPVNPSVYMNPSRDTICPGDEINVYVSGDFKQLRFNFGDGTIVNLGEGQNYAYHTYNQLGDYPISAQVTNYCGNDSLLKDTVHVVGSQGFDPNAVIHLNSHDVCPGANVSMYLSSNQYYRSYVWTYGDGSKKDSSSYSSTNHAFKSFGHYPVEVKVYNGCGESQIYQDSIHVVPNGGFPDGVNINGPNMAVCPQQPISLDATYGYKFYVWNMGDGSPKDSTSDASKDYFYSTPGNYQVACTIYNFCGEDSTVKFAVSVDGNAGFPSDPYFKLDQNPGGAVCPGQEVFLNAPTGYASYAWDYGDGSPVDSTFDASRGHEYPTEGEYTVNCRIYNYCGIDTVLQATVSVQDHVPFPTNDPNFRINTNTNAVCPGQRMSFNGPSGYKYYVWNYGDGVVDTTTTYWRDHFYTTPGTYDLKLTIQNFCGDDTTISTTVQVETNLGFPMYGFGLSVYTSPACPGQRVSLCAPYGNKAYVFDFGDGSPVDSTGNSCSDHRYGAPGTYAVSARVYNFCGYDTVITSSVEIDDQLEFTSSLSIDFEPQHSCPNHEIQMSASGGYESYVWYFGDGDTAYGGSSAAHRYENPGVYQVAVKITNYCGADSTIESFVTVDSLATFSSNINMSSWPESNCPGDLVSFDVTRGFETYFWSFGDGTFDTTNTGRIDHVYSALGNYSASVTIMNGCGNTITKKRSVSVVNNAAVPEMDLEVISSPLCPGDKVMLIPGGGDSGYDNFNFYWNFGDGTRDTTSGGTEHIFTNIGSYNVMVTVENGCGKRASIGQSVEVINNAQPVLDGEKFGVAAQSQYAGCAGDALLFYFFGEFDQNNWDFGDGVSASATEKLLLPNGAFATIVKHAYQSTGNYWAKLTLTNNCGNSVTDSVLVRVGGNLVVDGNMLIEPPMGGNKYTTCWPVTMLGIGGSKFFWSFGDGDTLTSYSPTIEHTYLTPGNYAVTLTITNACGNSATVNGAINVSGVGGPQINVSELDPVTCNAGSNGSAVATISIGQAPYKYIWDDNLQQTADTAVGLTAGTYHVTVTDANGCTSSQSVSVNEPQPIQVSTSKVDATCGTTDGNASAVASNGNAPYSYVWSNGKTTTIVTGLGKGIYHVTVTDGMGCTQSGAVNINEIGAPTLQADSLNDAGCYGAADGSVKVGLSGGTSPFAYTWSNGVTTQKATGLAAGSYTVTVTDSGGCSSVASFNVSQPSQIKITVSTTKSNCGTANGSASVTVSGGTSPYTYAWSTGGTGTSASGLPAGTYDVTVSDGAGCSEVKVVTVENTGSPQLANVVHNTTCNGTNDGAIDLTVTGGTTPYIYTWSNGGYTQDISGLQPGVYTLILQDGAGCLVVRNYTVSEPDELTSTMVASGTACTTQDGAVQVTAAGGTIPYSYVWSDGQTNATATGLATGDFQVTVTDANGCSVLDTAAVDVEVPMQEICIVTVDSTTEKNIVVWEKQTGLGIASFNVYKEDTVLNKFNLIGNVPFTGAYSEFEDVTSNPRAVAARYRITALDSCSNESVTGTIHKTMWLQAAHGTGGTISLMWTPYEGVVVPTYRVWRGTNQNPLSVLTTVAGSVTGYNDLSPSAGLDSITYVVEVVPATGCVATFKTKNYNSSRSNKTSIPPPPDSVDAVPNVRGLIERFELFPNPNRGSFTFNLELSKHQHVTMQLVNMHGQVIWTEKLGDVSGGLTRQVELDRHVPGIYFLQLVSDEAILTRKLVIE
ncbi:MAG: PKD domain-containing protein [Flavobacteriales bacterium]|nr:PKD domain-containing protein [Flavobacteriales bacterium]MCB9447884.1 PKD domain-containing protein [Flavobacteriales bacterium]